MLGTGVARPDWPRPTLAAFAWALLAAGCGGSSHPGRTSPLTRDEAPSAGRAGWVEVAGGGRTVTARGRPYSFWVRRGSPKRLLLFFEGGGGCFDYRSCRPGTTWFDDSVGPDDVPAFGSGLLDLDDPENSSTVGRGVRALDDRRRPLGRRAAYLPGVRGDAA